MSSREKILKAISKNKPGPAPLLEIIIDAVYDPSVLKHQFITTLKAIGATVILAENIQIIKDDLQKDIENGEYIVNTIEVLGNLNKEINITSEAVF